MENKQLPSAEEKELFLQRQELLAYLLEEEGVSLSQECKISPRTQKSEVPLSFSQRRLWFFEQFDMGNPLYTIPIACRLHGELQRTALEQSLNEIVHRHEILRTTFGVIDGQPVQVAATTGCIPLQALDLRVFPENERESEMLKILKEEANQAVDLAHGPLIRAHLLQLAKQEHVLLLVVHHIVIDEWSIRIILREFADLYVAFSGGGLSPLSDLPVQYADYALWQREWMQGEILRQELSYWCKQLTDLPHLQLPTDHPPPSVQTYRGGHVNFVLSQTLTEQLKVLCQSEGVTLFMVLLAAFQILLARYCQQRDIAVGTTIANRSQAEVENLVGFFVNTLVLRIDLAGNPTCRELLSRVRKTTLEAYTHQEVPFEQVVEALQPERAFNYVSLFQTMLVLHNAPLEALKLPNLTLQPLLIDRDMSELDLGLDFFDTEHGLMGLLEYSADLFEPATINRMIGHLQVILEALVADPAQHIDTLPLLTEQECRQILIEWNMTEADYPSHMCAHEEIERQVARTPDAIAAVFNHQRLTFSELNEQANQLAHYLRARGVGPEIRVGICVEHSLEMLVSMLGVIKAGGAYVPFDPTYPQDRLDFMVDDTRIAVLVVQQQFVEKFQACAATLVCLDREQQAIDRCSTENVQSGVVPGNLIYVIYTSGSTGLPKGVTITHAHLMNMFYAWNATYDLRSLLQAHLQMSSFSVDLFICDAIQTLCTGAKLVMCPQDDVLMPERLYALMRQEGVNSGEFVPAVLQKLVDYVEETGQLLDFMDIIVAGADSWHARDYQAVRRLGGPRTRVINGYGSTEVTIDSTYFEGGEDYTTTDGVVPLGRPFPDTEIYVLDAAMQPVPVGITGEIYIGGKRPGRGYLNRPELTAERFVPHPFGQSPGARLYRMGDLGRYRPDGVIEFMGRADYQVKIRGFRIELGEIEAALKDLPTVQEAVVLVHESGRSEDKRLVAYVVPKKEVPEHAGTLRRALQERLPYYMVPSAILFLDEIPLNATGKINRRALPEPDGSEVAGEHSYVAPRNPIEEIVAAIWREVLEVKQIGAYDNFFERGGHSLLATQAISRLRQIFDGELPLRTLFEFPRVAEIAQHIQEMLAGEQRRQAPPLECTLLQEDLPLSFAQQRLWFLDQLEPASAFYTMAEALHMRGILHPHALEQGVNEIVQRHAVLRTTFPSREGSPQQVVAPSLHMSLPLIDLSDWPPTAREEEIRRVVTLAMQRPFDLAQGPLLRTTLVRLAEREHVLIVSMHHIVADGWSVGIFIQELQTLYAAHAAGQVAQLAPLSIQYIDYTCWQRQWLQEEVLQSQLTYWQQTLAGIPALLQLPTDRPRPSVQSYRGATVTFELSAELTASLNALSQRNSVTLFMLLLAAFQVLLMRYSGQDDIVVGTPIANRTRAEIEGLIGCFVNTLALRVNLSGNPSFEQLLTQVREVCLGAYAHQDLPFEQVVDALQPERNLSQNPLFQVMFTLDDEFSLTEQFIGLTTTTLEMEGCIAKFDLTLDLRRCDHGIYGAFEYSTDLFDAATIGRLIAHWQILLECIVSNPTQPLSDLSLLCREEREKVLTQWNPTPAVYAQDMCIHHLIEVQAKRTPEAIAITQAQSAISYRELNECANRLAHQLKAAYVGLEVRVGVCMDRSIEMVVAFLGILKAGGAYVPLDPTLPQARLAFLLEDAAVSLLLTQQKLVPQLASCNVPLRCVEIDKLSETVFPSPELCVSTVSPENLAYVIYTSGSTGMPKGVMITHANLVNAAHMWSDAYGLSATSSHLQQANCSFDVCSGEIIRALSTGAKLVICEREDVMRPERLYDLLLREKIDCAEFTPAVLQNLVEYVEQLQQSLAFMHVLIAGSDSWNVGEYARVQALIGSETRLINSYGITEAAIDSAYFAGGEHTILTTGSVPIGRPFADIQVYLFDRIMQPVPVGVPGEIYIGGNGLGRGYLKRPDLTAEQFVPHPFSQKPGARLYRTGDLGRYLPDGTIEFLGRADYQVKIRGFRIELGEVENALRRLSQIKEAVVLLHELSAQDKYLVAYVVRQPDCTLESRAIRSLLEESLPYYMIPALIVFVEEIPLNANGKLNRRALPAPDFSMVEREAEQQETRTPIEELLAGIWIEVLGGKQIGMRENFFERGGHSLLATQVMARIQKVLHIELPVRSIFEAPTIRALAQCIHDKRFDLQEMPPLEAREWEHEGSLLLSYAQQRLWFLDQLEPNKSLYNMFEALHLQGEFDRNALEKSLQVIVQRHEILRTNIITLQGEPRQVIAPHSKLSLSLVDMASSMAEEREIALPQMIQQEVQKTFDLASDSPIRVTLFRMNAQEHILLLCIHHIAADGWSIAIFTHELNTLYTAFSAGKASPLRPLTLQYVDYAYWQRQWLQGRALQEQLDYWKTQLSGVPSLLQLPFDYARPAERLYTGETITFDLPARLIHQLQDLSRHENTTLFMTLLAAFQVLLLRYSGQDDIVVGTPVANRIRPEFETLIGFFVNTLALRIKFTGTPTFREVMARVREVCLDAYTHQSVPFEQIIESVQPERHLNHDPLFQVMFILQNAPQEAPDLAGLTLHPLTIEDKFTDFDITLSLQEHPDGIRGSFVYSTELFEPATIQRMKEHYGVLLEAIVANPDRLIHDLPLLTEAELHQVVRTWNATQRPFQPEERLLHECFEDQVVRTPNAIALRYETEYFTYDELNQRANQLAHYLQKLGVDPDYPVGIQLGHSLNIGVALLGILKSGGFYVPLDPAYPVDYLMFAVRDMGIKLIVTQEHACIPGLGDDIEYIYLDKEREQLAAEKTTNPYRTLSGDNLGYSIYTSGSTGQPKGVAVPHRAIVNHARAIAEHYSIGPGDNVLQFAALSFDVAAEEFYPSWSSGATVILSREPGLMSFADLHAYITREQISVLNLPTPYWHEWTTHIILFQQQIPACLRLVVIGSDTVQPAQVTAWCDHIGSRIQLKNAYGLTEATITTTVYDVPAEGNAGVRSVPIGRPVANTQVYLLDASRQPVPPGVSGELYIGGAGLARGYWRRPDLTAEKFVPDPFSNQPGARLYRTGDIGHYLPDGTIAFRGRADLQLKIHGYRIEPAEIEGALQRHPGVKAAFVVARTNAQKHIALVAYVVPKTAYEVTSSDLKIFLLQQLPDYKVPGIFMFLESLPLTPNGKVERNALPEPVFLPNITPANRVYTPTEEILVNLWRDLLHLADVEVHANFFELGGHSLLAIQLISCIREIFEVDLAVRTLFSAPTIALLAPHIDRALRANQRIQKPIPRLAVREQPIPLSFAQQRLWILDQLEPASPRYTIPVAVRLRGHLHEEALVQSLQEIAHRQEALKTVFSASDGYPSQMVIPTLTVPFRKIMLIEEDASVREREALRLLNEEANQPFNLAQPPLWRVLLLQLSQEEFLLALTMHHIIADGWSIDILLRELNALYNSYLAGKPLVLQPLRRQYADYAFWQRQWLQGDVLREQIRYWQEQLAGAPPLHAFPTDRQRPAIQSYQGATCTFHVPALLTSELKTLSLRENVTLFMTLLAAFQILLMRYSGQTDIVVGSPSANRSLAALEDLIGCFINTLVLRSDLSGNPSFREYVRRVRTLCLDAYAYQDVPFEQIVEALNLERNLSYEPLVQILFVLHNNASTSLQFNDITVAPVAIEEGTAKFDLTFELQEVATGLQGSVEYSTDLFEQATILRMIDHFQVLLAGIVAAPDTSLLELPLLTPFEQHRMLIEWNTTQRVYPDRRCIHELIAEQAARTPGALAVVYERQQLTYEELDRRAASIAVRIRAVGGRAESYVALYMERSIEIVIGLLGVLKAGAAYLPLDPSYPQERISFMLEDAHVAAVLTQAHLVERLPASAAPIICLDRPLDWELTDIDDSTSSHEVTLAQAAYVLYTSGSTGQPKGVVIEHRSLVNFLFAMRDALSFSAENILLAVTTLSFDIAALEIFLPLLVGARVVIASREDAIDSARLAVLMERSHCTIMQATPATWRLLLAAGWQGNAHLEILCGGEALSQDLATQLLEKGSCVWNVYGPTETTIWSTVHKISSKTEPILIGHPLANTQTYVLDSHLQPVPIGVAGELYLGGEGVARGYLHLPATTAERFVPHPYTPGERLYRTGDLVRYRTDGCLEYLHRLDTQVKVRGYRIELEEIETILMRHPEIREVAVIVQKDTGSEHILVAYLVPREQQQFLTQSALRTYLGKQLPDYMHPSRFVIVDALPLTPNGKVDRRALVHLDGRRVGSEGQFVPPATPVEQLLANIWAQVLEIERVSIHDNFFSLGGDSILAIQVITKANQQQLSLTPRQLFQHQTIAQLAAAYSTESITGSVQKPAQMALEQYTATSYPLSPLQQGLLFHTLSAPQTEMYFEQVCYKLQGELGIEALQQAWQQVVQEYTVLRSTFAWENLSEPVQIVQPQLQIPFTSLNWQGLTPSEVQQRLADYLAADRQSDFDLTQAPPMRLTLLQVTADAYYFVWSYHHILLDGWSIMLLLKKVLTFYKAISEGHPIHFEQVRPYRDYIAWLYSQDRFSAEAFWRQELQGFTSPTYLPIERQHAEILKHDPHYEEQEYALPGILITRLHNLALQHHLTLNTLLQGAWASLLSCYSSERDILYGTVTSGRSAALEGVDTMVGLFISTLPVRVRLSPQFSVITWLKALQEHLASIRQYEYCSLSDIQKWSAIPASLPLFTNLFIFENYPVDTSLSKWNAVVQIEEVAFVERTNYPLTVVASLGDSLWLRANYDSEVFETAAITRLLQQWQTILEHIVEDPEQRLADLTCLTDAERQELLVDWNSTAQHYPEDQCLQQLFERQVGVTPDALAIVRGHERLTYDELNQRANQLAHYLQQQHIKPGTHVGLFMERSVDMLISVLAVLKVGGVYIPLDIGYPQERLAFMRQDAGITVLVTQQHLIESFSERLDTFQLIVIDAERTAIERAPVVNVACQITSQHIAYILYTSGSTGAPKGVMIPHKALVNYLSWCCEAYSIAQGQGTPVHTSLSFDLTCTSLFAPLLVGRPVILLPQMGEQDLEILSQTLQIGANLSLVKMTPTHLEILNRLLPIGELAGRTNMLVLGGETLQGHQVLPWQTSAPHTRLINEYGPTEATVGCCAYELSSEETIMASVPIGRPIANTQLYVLNANLLPVPVGVPAELYIGGVGLAYGYWNRADLTAERFIPHPFSTIPGARLYKTGDLVRYLPDGTLEFLGREDTQVKLRGYRIELAEIETLLLQHVGVQEAVVTLWNVAPGDQRLVAYVVPAAGYTGALWSQELRESLLQTLPDYMVPAVYLFLERLPITGNGKLDRKALPLPGEQRYRGAGFVEPQTDRERLIADIWREVLRIEKIGVHDNFFELGGHSLLILQVYNKLRPHFRLTLVDLFTYPTISALANFLRSGEQAARPLATQQAQKRSSLIKQQRLSRQQQRQFIKGEQEN